MEQAAHRVDRPVEDMLEEVGKDACTDMAFRLVGTPQGQQAVVVQPWRKVLGTHVDGLEV